MAQFEIIVHGGIKNENLALQGLLNAGFTMFGLFYLESGALKISVIE